ncbi:MAG: hypothetical protein KBC73_15160 [Burkholderiaceae bacterium]|nr:hypothetical protein [Burkholderiaceae bacterium]
MMQRRLLVLDDDPTVAQILQMGAQSLGFDTRLCLSAAEFHPLQRDWQPSHVVLDLALPDAGIGQVLERLAADGCRARLLVCSGASLGEIEAALDQARARGLLLAGNGALPKPFRLAQLRQLLAAG